MLLPSHIGTSCIRQFGISPTRALSSWFTPEVVQDTVTLIATLYSQPISPMAMSLRKRFDDYRYTADRKQRCQLLM